MKIFAADIGGTFVKTCIVNEHGLISEFQEYKTESHYGGKYIIRKLMTHIKSYRDIDAIGISTAGQVDSVDGRIIFANKNIPNYTGLNIKEMMQKEFNVPVMVENDVNSAALGELRYGSGKDMTDCLCLTFGTGVGGAVIKDSHLIKGTNGIAGEFGHMITKSTREDKRPGFYEQYASTSALVEIAREVDPECINGKVFFGKLNRNNKPLYDVFIKWINEVAAGLVSLIHIFNPPVIIIGGGIMEQQQVVDAVNARVKELILNSFSEVKIEKATLGNKAGLLGVASLLT